MTAKLSLALFIVVATTLIAAIATGEAIAPNETEHRAYEARLAARNESDQSTARHALESRFGFSASYDELAKDARDAASLRVQSRVVPGFLLASERRGLLAALSKYDELAERRALLLEHFKSENALLRNSMRYFPSAAAAALKRSHDLDLTSQLVELRHLTLSMALEDDGRAKQSQAALIVVLREATAGELPNDQKTAVEGMLAHAAAIGVHKTETDRLLRELLALPFEPARAHIEDAYEAGFARAQRQTHQLGRFISALAVLLLALASHAWLRLRRAAVGLRCANERLEEAVAARTSELESEMQRRAQVEVELRQAQKLEAVGQLASGIAHEINTPIQYVGDSLYFLREAFKDVMHLAEVGAAASADVDLELLKAEVPEAFERTADGIKQVASIVKAMKTFAHNSLDKMPLDLNAAIHNTLTVARNEYKYVADVTTDLGPVPEVICNAGGIRQVLLNLVVNAAHAIADVVAGSNARGSIRIASTLHEQVVRISVADTGGGIPEAIRERIFEPFFTTKEPGRGSGQGLAICQSLIKQHGGKLWFETEIGAGTTFFVELPINADSRNVERPEAA